MSDQEKAIHTFAAKVHQLILQYQDVKKENDELYGLVDERDQEIKKLKEDIPQEYLDKYKATRLTEYNKEIKENSWYLSQLTDCAYYNLRFTGKSDFTKNLDKLTVKTLRKKAAKYFDTDNAINVILYPEQ